MGSTTTQTTIANRALQLVGYKPIGSLQDNDRGARAINRAYLPTLESVLRENYWSFSLQRAIVPASSIKPAFGKRRYFPLPPDFLMLGPPDQYLTYPFGALPLDSSPTDFPIITGGSNPVETGSQRYETMYRDWQIEQMGNDQGLAIASDQASPLRFRYVSNDIQENSFDSCFAEALAIRLAIEICEELTQSNTKLAALGTLYKEMMATAKRRNSFEEQPVQSPVDPYILVRM